MKQVDLLSYLPPVLRLVREFQSLAKTGDIEAGAMWESRMEVEYDQFVDTLNVYGIERWEGMLGIKPLGTDTLEDRRFRIKAWMASDLPYTIRALNRMLETLCGTDGYALTLDGFSMNVKLELTVKKQFHEVEKLLERVVPANIEILVNIRYNQWYKVAPLRWRELAEKTWDDVRNDTL